MIFRGNFHNSTFSNNPGFKEGWRKNHNLFSKISLSTVIPTMVDSGGTFSPEYQNVQLPAPCSFFSFKTIDVFIETMEFLKVTLHARNGGISSNGS